MVYDWVEVVEKAAIDGKSLIGHIDGARAFLKIIYRLSQDPGPLEIEGDLGNCAHAECNETIVDILEK